MSAMHDRIVALHGRHALKRSILSIREGAGVMQHFLEGRGVRTALEIGTYRGVGAAEISQFVDRVITIDLRHGRMEQLGEEWDRHAFWRSLGVHNVELHLVDDDAEKAAAKAEFGNRGPGGDKPGPKPNGDQPGGKKPEKN